MSTTICLAASTLNYPTGGGHRWVYLNWALGLRAAGCDVIWLERAGARTSPDRLAWYLARLKRDLAPYGLADAVALFTSSGLPVLAPAGDACLSLDACLEADLLLNMKYVMPPDLVRRFKRSALVDIDPGLLQIWMSEGQMDVPEHDVHFTTGETVGQPGSLFPDGGRRWHYTPPCVALDAWPVRAAGAEAAFTTVSQWGSGEWVTYGEESYANDKRDGFLPFLDLPARTPQPLELALNFGGADEERGELRRRGWRVREAEAVAGSPAAYRRYVRGSRGEFSCVKPSCVRLQNAWISDRTLCYLASGKPAVVQHTGPSRFLPDAAGLFRFRTPDEAARHLDAATSDYDRQGRLARALVEEHFDARKVAASVVERALA